MATATVTTTLASELSAFKANFVKDVPKQVLETFMAKTQELAATGIVDTAIHVGDTAPDFTLPDSQGNSVSLSKLLQKGPVVLTFYRGGWCPYCNLTVRAFQKALPEIQAKGATFVAISPELPDYINKTKEDAKLTFPVLSDLGLKVASQYGIKFVLDPELQAIYNQFGLDVNGHNGDKSFQLPLPATYVIHTDGEVKYAFVNVDYSQRAEPAKAIAAIDYISL